MPIWRASVTLLISWLVTDKIITIQSILTRSQFVFLSHSWLSVPASDKHRYNNMQVRMNTWKVMIMSDRLLLARAIRLYQDTTDTHKGEKSTAFSPQCIAIFFPSSSPIQSREKKIYFAVRPRPRPFSHSMNSSSRTAIRGAKGGWTARPSSSFPFPARESALSIGEAQRPAKWCASSIY